jgi:hypothetical protein
MKRIPQSAYPSQSVIAQRIEALEQRAMGFAPVSDEHRSIMRELADLRAYAEMSEWLRPVAPVPNTLKG